MLFLHIIHIMKMKNNTENLLFECVANVEPEIIRQIDISFNLANKIDEVLSQKNITYDDFAIMLNVGRDEVDKYMCGMANLDILTIAKIECALNTQFIIIK